MIDVVQLLTGSKSAKRYWSDLKRRLAQGAGSGQLYEEIIQLKLTATDGKPRPHGSPEQVGAVRAGDQDGMN